MKAARIISGGLKLLGFTNAAKVTFTYAIKDGSSSCSTCSWSKLDITQRQAQKTQLDYQKSAERIKTN
jgi:hypothetical protein